MQKVTQLLFRTDQCKIKNKRTINAEKQISDIEIIVKLKLRLKKEEDNIKFLKKAKRLNVPNSFAKNNQTEIIGIDRLFQLINDSQIKSSSASN